MNPKVDDFLSKINKWQQEMEFLRNLVLDCHLTEELKWGVPCYSFQNNNVLIIHGFKEYVALNFFKGSLLNDPEKILVQQTENVQGARQIRFTSLQQIEKMESTVKAYVFEAIEVEKMGLKVEMKKTEDFKVPEELTLKFIENPTLKTAFEKLTPGRQKGYLLHFSGAKQSKTRESRIEECMSKIFKGKGLNDCTCGLSKRMPNCDGSHKNR